jgi:hypothetical protein
MFFYWKFVFSDGQVSEHIWKQLEATFRKIWGQNISLKNPNPYPNPKKIICGSEFESEKMSSDPQHWLTSTGNFKRISPVTNSSSWGQKITMDTGTVPVLNIFYYLGTLTRWRNWRLVLSKREDVRRNVQKSFPCYPLLFWFAQLNFHKFHFLQE